MQPSPPRDSSSCSKADGVDKKEVQSIASLRVMTSPQSIEAAGPEASPESRPNFGSAARELSLCGEEAAGGKDETDNFPDVPEEEKNIEEPRPVDVNLENMARSNWQKVAKFLHATFGDFCPLKYIKRNIDYCIRVRVNSCKIIDLHYRYMADCYKFLNAKWMEHENDEMTFEFKR